MNYPRAIREATPKHTESPYKPEMAPLVALGGLLTVKRHYPLYRKLLNSGQNTSLSAEERYIPMPNRGLGSITATRKQINKEVRKKYRALRQPMVLVGHSLGGLGVTMAALDNPEVVAGVVCLGGAQEGISQETLASLALRYYLGNPKEAADIRHDSNMMQEHKQRIQEEWPEGVPLQLTSVWCDYLLMPPIGLRLSLPGAEQPRRRILTPPVPGIGLLVRRVPGMPKDTDVVQTLFPTEHVLMPLNPAVISHITDMRLNVSTANHDRVVQAA